MKKIILFFSILLFVSCNNDDDNIIIEEDQHETVATWHLTRFTRYLSQPYEYTDEITWVINPNNTIDITIEEGTDISSIMPFNSSGSYTYTINENDDRNEIIINGITYYFIIGNTGEQFAIEDEIGFAADGLLLLFDKVVVQN